MALKINYEHDDFNYPDAYVKIQKIVCTANEVEVLTPSDETSVVLTFRKEPEHIAQVFMFTDSIARQHNAIPFHTFGISFDYDINNGGNIYQEAYKALKNVERFKDKVIKDI